MATKHDRPLNDIPLYIPIDDRDPASVRAVILARSSDPGAKPEDMRGQVEQCRAFIAAMDWHLAFDAYAFTESKSGMRSVARPVLDAVLKLAIQGEVDVIVCREFERVARSKGRRWQAIQTALDFGVEFRYANEFVKDPASRGKRDDSGTMRIIREVEEWRAEAEAEKITERLMPEKLRRYEEGLPHGNLYGYGPGERRLGKHGKPMGLLSWVIVEEQAQWVRWLFDWVDHQPPAEVSYRTLAGELVQRGVPTPSGKGDWSATQVRSILTNPKYCGQGRGLRFRSEMKPERDPNTRIVRDILHVHDRQREAERLAKKDPAQADAAQADYLANTYPIAPGAIPPIIDPEQWERVQEKLKDAVKLNNRGGPRRTDSEAHSTLLDHGYIRCAECNGRMTRHWGKSKHPYYRCHKNADRPGLPHKMFHVPAHKVDALARRLLAKALTNPERILELATAAEEQLADATTDAELAAATLAHYHKRLAEIDAQQDELMTALAALRKVPGMEGQVQGIRARLAQLDREREEAETESATAVPQRDYAQQRANFLRSLFSHRDTIFDPITHEIGGAGEPRLVVGEWLPVMYAARVLGVRLEGDNVDTDNPEAPVFHVATLLKALGAEMSHEEEDEFVRGFYIDYHDTSGNDVSEYVYDEVKTEYVVYWLLAKLPRDRFRTLLHDLDAVVMVERGPSWAEYVEHGPTPIEDRVYLQLLGTVRVGTDVTKLKISS